MPTSSAMGAHSSGYFPGLRIWMALKGQIVLHFPQPVHFSTAWITADFTQFFASRLSRCSGQAPAHRPHPVQPEGFMTGTDVPGKIVGIV